MVTCRGDANDNADQSEDAGHVPFLDWFRDSLCVVSKIYVDGKRYRPSQRPFVVHQSDLSEGVVTSDLLLGIKNLEDVETLVLFKIYGSDDAGDDPDCVSSPLAIRVSVPPRSIVAPLDGIYPLPLLYAKRVCVQATGRVAGVFCNFNMDVRELICSTSAQFGDWRWTCGDLGDIAFPSIRAWLQNLNRRCNAAIPRE